MGRMHAPRFAGRFSRLCLVHMAGQEFRISHSFAIATTAAVAALDFEDIINLVF